MRGLWLQQFAVTPGDLADNARAEIAFDPRDGWTLSVRSSGPSTKTRNEHLARGLHRMAFNAIADALGPARAVAYFSHLRSYVLASEAEPMRACLFDEKTLNENLRAPRPWKASYELPRDEEGAHAIAFLRLGIAFFYVSLKPSIDPLREFRSRHSWLRVVGELSESEKPAADALSKSGELRGIENARHPRIDAVGDEHEPFTRQCHASSRWWHDDVVVSTRS